MSQQVQHVRFKVRGDTAATLAARNEVPLARELIVETDTLKMKLGDGATQYNALDYIATGGGGVIELREGTLISVDATDPARPIVSVDDDPEDGFGYVRKNGQWVREIDPTTGNAPVRDQGGGPIEDQNGQPVLSNALPIQWSQIEPLPEPIEAVIAGMPELSAFALGDAPSPSPPWRLLVLTDIVGGPEVCYSDGTVWRRCSDKTEATT